MREPNRMSVADARKEADAHAMGWKQWEAAIKGMLRQAETAFGNRPEPTALERKKGKTPLAPDAGWWRDKDRATKEENRKRMPGQLDFVYWRVYHDVRQIPRLLIELLPPWKREHLARWEWVAGPMSFDLHIEAKTGKAVPNDQQLRTLRRVALNPGAHPILVYPADRVWLRGVLGL